MTNILTNPQSYAELPLTDGYTLIRQAIPDEFFCQDEIVLYLDFKCPYNVQKSFKIKVKSVDFENNVCTSNGWATTQYINTHTFREGKIYKRVDVALLRFDTKEYQLAEKITKSFIRESFDGQPIMDFLESF